MYVSTLAACCMELPNTSLLRRPSYLLYTCVDVTTQVSTQAAWHQTCHVNSGSPSCTKRNLACSFWRYCAVLFCMCHLKVMMTITSLSRLTTSSLGDTLFAVNAGWGAESGGAWGPTAYLEPPAAPRHFTNTEQPYVEHVTTTAVPQGSETTGCCMSCTENLHAAWDQVIARCICVAGLIMHPFAEGPHLLPMTWVGCWCSVMRNAPACRACFYISHALPAPPLLCTQPSQHMISPFSACDH